MIARMIVRRYESGDREVVRRIHAEAFGKGDDATVPSEVGLFDALVDAGDAIDQLSFVAVRADAPVGHVVCSRATVAAHPVVALGPIGVLRNHQRQGVGSAMMHAVLGAAEALDVPLLVLLGSTDYYRRFGFRPATELCVEPPEEWGDYFQARTLSAYKPSIQGRFRYAPAFEAL